jgi:hypothetical protein
MVSEFICHAGKDHKGFEFVSMTVNDGFNLINFPSKVLLMKSVWSTELNIEQIRLPTHKD